MTKDVYITFPDVQSFVNALDLLEANAPRMALEYEMVARMVDAPQMGPGGRFQTPGAIFLTFEGHDKAQRLWRGISFTATLVEKPVQA